MVDTPGTVKMRLLLRGARSGRPQRSQRHGSSSPVRLLQQDLPAASVAVGRLEDADLPEGARGSVNAAGRRLGFTCRPVCRRFTLRCVPMRGSRSPTSRSKTTHAVQDHPHRSLREPTTIAPPQTHPVSRDGQLWPSARTVPRDTLGQAGLRVSGCTLACFSERTRSVGAEAA